MRKLRHRVGRTRDNDMQLVGPLWLNRWAVWFIPLFLIVLFGGSALFGKYPWGKWLVSHVAWMLVVGLALFDLIHRLRLTHFAMEFTPGIEHHIQAKWWQKLFYRECGWSLLFIAIPIPIWLLAGGLTIFLARGISWTWPQWEGKQTMAAASKYTRPTEYLEALGTGLSQRTLSHDQALALAWEGADLARKQNDEVLEAALLHPAVQILAEKYDTTEKSYRWTVERLFQIGNDTILVDGIMYDAVESLIRVMAHLEFEHSPKLVEVEEFCRHLVRSYPGVQERWLPDLKRNPEEQRHMMTGFFVVHGGSSTVRVRTERKERDP
ncbi:MAG: hypothetical protein H7833_06295 [Magnetococcus sp. DMHC-1]